MNRPQIGRPLAQAGERRDWYRIVDKLQARDEDGGGTYAEVYIYDEISSYWGIGAAEFIAELAAVKAPQITLHLNSPGGDVFDGIAIMEGLRNHPATITVKIDALAASIASVIAMAGDRIVVGRNAQMMVHDASGGCWGNADDMAQMHRMLDRTSDIIAGAYADRAGGEVADWRATMKAETWYSAQQAVDAGLADEVAALPAREEQAALAAVARWDLDRFQHPEPALALVARATTAPPQADPEPEPVTVNIEVSGSFSEGELVNAVQAAARLNPPDPLDVLSPPPEPLIAPVIDTDLIRNAVKAAVAPDLPFDPDVFRAAVTSVANNAPAPPDLTPTPASAEPDFTIDRSAFERSIREARL